jgi:hypothetical protein
MLPSLVATTISTTSGRRLAGGRSAAVSACWSIVTLIPALAAAIASARTHANPSPSVINSNRIVDLLSAIG